MDPLPWRAAGCIFGPMNNFDILIYAALAAFLVFRLWSVLGQRGEDDPARPNPFERTQEKEQDEENVVVLEGRPRVVQTEALTLEGHAPASLAGTLDQMRSLDPSFDEKKFMDGAKLAFKQIVESFAAGDMSSVAWLLGPDVRKTFDQAMADRKAKRQVWLNKIERLAAADIVAAKIIETKASLTIEFVSHQSHMILEEGETEYGKVWPRAEETRDLWTFHRDLKSEDPNWLLVETRS